MVSAAEQLAANINWSAFGKAEELKKRILFTLAALVIYRLGTYIPLPGIDPAAFVQQSLSRSARGVVRGLHVRRGNGEAKLVRCSYGAIFDVVVDLRVVSPTYRNWESFELRDEEQLTLYVPAGCAHGFQALTDTADVSYLIDRRHDPAEDVSIAFDDPELSIAWPLPVTVMSPRDRQAPSLAAAASLLT